MNINCYLSFHQFHRYLYSIFLILLDQTYKMLPK